MLLRAVIAALSLAACLQIANATFAPARGLQAEYFTGEPGGGPALTGVDQDASTDAIQRRWLGSPPTNFSVRWYGFLTIGQPGRYTFSVSSDDGALLAIDESIAIDNGGRHGLQTQTTTLDLERGAHSIVIDFQQAGGPFAMEWRMAPEGQPLAPPARWSVTPEEGRIRNSAGGPARRGAAFRARVVCRGTGGVARMAAPSTGSPLTLASRHWRSSSRWRWCTHGRSPRISLT